MNYSGQYRAHLQRGGIGLVEMRRLLLAWAEHGDWGRLREQAFRENLLGKRSDDIIKMALGAFRRRFLSERGLPPASFVVRMLQASIPEAAQNQVLFPYFLRADPLAERCYRDLVLPRLRDSAPSLNSEEVKAHLETLALEHPELARWSPYLRARWARGFIALLRQFSLMERYPMINLKRLYLLPEPFAFFWLWGWEQNGSFWNADRLDLWELLQADRQSRERLLIEGELRGWWTYQRLGTIVFFHPHFPTLAEWLVAQFG
ncbi:MAG: DUF1819 family protein [Anaerolineae bacterium]|nr:DUF1819 family protein [Anaerolineae bacterium]